MNDSFNINRSSSVKSNLSDNVSYTQQNRKMNFSLNNNNRINYQNLNHMNNVNNIQSFNTVNFNDKVNFMTPNINNPSHNNPNIKFMQTNQNFNYNQNNLVNNSSNINDYSNMLCLSNKMYNFSNGNNNMQNYVQMKLNNSEILNHNCSYNTINTVHLSNKNENNDRLNNSINLMNKNYANNDIWRMPNQFPYQNCYSTNTSVGKHSFSDNENDNQINEFSKKRYHYGSFSSQFSNSSFDNLNDSLRNEKDYDMILGNPDEDSIDMDNIEYQNISPNVKNLKNTDNDKKYGKNDIYYIETIEETNNILKELIKEGESNLKEEDLKFNDEEEDLNKNNFLEYLKSNKFFKLYNLIKNDYILIHHLVKYSDEKIYDLIETENLFKADSLISVLMKYEEKIEGDDVMESLNNLNFEQ